jgi:hypothetical protein
VDTRSSGGGSSSLRIPRPVCEKALHTEFTAANIILCQKVHFPLLSIPCTKYFENTENEKSCNSKKSWEDFVLTPKLHEAPAKLSFRLETAYCTVFV